MSDRPGFVVDWPAVVTAGNNYTFESGKTYQITGSVPLGGNANGFSGQITIQPDVVIKYDRNSSLIILSGTILDIKSMPYQPCLITGKDDSSVGQAISGATGTPTGYYADCALLCYGVGIQYHDATGAAQNGCRFQNMRVSNATIGISISGGSDHQIASVQFVGCSAGVQASGVSQPATR